MLTEDIMLPALLLIEDNSVMLKFINEHFLYADRRREREA
jgi:hypothetical protein